MQHLVPASLFLTKGVGTHKENKNARDVASREAGIGDRNIVTVSSVLPASIKTIGRDDFRRLTKPGEIIFAINGICESNVPGQRVSAGLAIAQTPGDTGYVTELFEHPGIEDAEIQQRVETMALQLFAEENGAMDFVAANVWQRGKTDYTIAGKPVKLQSMVASGVCNLDGDYTCAIVAAILLP